MKDEKFNELKKAYSEKIFRRKTLEEFLEKEEFDPWQKELIKKEIDELDISKSQQELIDYVKTQDAIKINNKEEKEIKEKRNEHINNLLSNYL